MGLTGSPHSPAAHRLLPRPAAVALGLLLAVGLTLSPTGTRLAVAADPLRVSADATYTLDPAARRVHVVVSFAVTDLKPNSAQYVYYYTGYRFSVQAEARSIRATDGRGALSVKTNAREFYTDTTVNFRNYLYYKQTARFTVRFDLVGGAPRSDSSVRVGKAFATFGVWAWGDEGKGSVVVHTPQGFGSTVDGNPMSITSSGGSETLRATPEDPWTFFAIVSAENPLAYTQDRLSLGDGVEIVVMAWPEDEAWDDTVTSTLRKALPELRDLIGLDWPVAHDLQVRERYTPSLEGYAGVFFTETQRIDVSEDLDPVVIVHEAAHAWLNGELFIERWIYEGLAQEYAYRVQQALGGPDGGAPAVPGRDDPGHVLLSRWTFPEVIRDQQTDDQERYGYEASFWVIHRLVNSIGVERMRDAFAAADAHTTAYPGAGTPETVSATNSWKRFVDLVESFERQDSTDFERSLKDYVLTVGSADELRDRADAREAYGALLEAGEGWLPGWYVRKPMGEWRFDVAEVHIADATAVLGLRDKVDDAAAALGLSPDDALKSAYEDAQDGFGAATTLANDELAALAAIADAEAKVEAQPDFISQLGLWGETPLAPYDASRAAFERGDIAGAAASAATAAALVTGAAAVGQQRLAIAIGVAVGLLVLLLVLAVMARRRRRRRALAFAAAAADASPETAEPVTGEPYATLAADPDAAPPPPPSSESPPEG